MKNKITVIITGHRVENFDTYLKYLIHSMGDVLKECRYILYYDESSFIDLNEINKINKVLDLYGIVDYEIKVQNGGLLSAFYYMLQDIKTDYFLFLEHDWVFTKLPDFESITKSLDNHNFVNCIKFKKIGNVKRQLNSTVDSDGNPLPFQTDNRINEIKLIQACYWSNNPFVCKLDTMKEWSKNFIKENTIIKIKNNKLKMGSNGIEEVMIKLFVNDLKINSWSKIKDKWGVYLYGDVGDEPIIAHTDGSNRYKGLPEKNGIEWIEKNKKNVLQ